MKTVLALIATIAVIMAVFLAGCSSGESPAPTVPPRATSAPVFATETTVPAPSPRPPAGTPTPVPIIASNGLGARKDVWEKMHGAPRMINSLQAVYDGYLEVTFDGRGVIAKIAGDFESRGMVSLEEAKSESLKLIPGDAVHTYHFDHPTIATPDPKGETNSEPLVLVDLYNSKSLSTLFPLDAWFHEEPGTFYVEYDQYKSKGDQIGRFFMELSSPP